MSDDAAIKDAFNKAASHKSKADEIRSHTPEKATPQLKAEFGAAVRAQNEQAAAARAQVEQARRDHEARTRAVQQKAEADRQAAERRTQEQTDARRREQERQRLEQQKQQAQRDLDAKREKDEEQRRTAADAFERASQDRQNTASTPDRIKTASKLEHLRQGLHKPAPAPKPPRPSWAPQVDKEIADRHQKEVAKRITEHQNSLQRASRTLRRDWNNSR